MRHRFVQETKNFEKVQYMKLQDIYLRYIRDIELQFEMAIFWRNCLFYHQGNCTTKDNKMIRQSGHYLF